MSQVMDEFCLLYLAGFSLVVPECSDVRYLAAHCAAVHATVVVHSKKNLESPFCQGSVGQSTFVSKVDPFSYFIHLC